MKRTAILSLMLLAVISCNKEGGPGENEKAILGVEVKNLENLVEIPENQVKTYEVNVVSIPGPSDALTITLGADETLVDVYNQENGTSYQMLPAAAYEISSSPLMLMRYNKKSSVGTIKLKGAGCEMDKTYLLPIVVESVKGTAAYEAPVERVAYVVYRMIPREVDGRGTADDPYLITDVQTFNKIGNLLLEGTTVYFKQVGDIDFEGRSWAQIDAAKASVSYNGDGHRVSNVVSMTGGMFLTFNGIVENLTIENASVDAGSQYAAIFADATGEDVVIKNVTISNSTLSNVGFTGTLIGKFYGGNVEGVRVADCEISGAERTAGLVSHMYKGTLKDCEVSADITSAGYYCGGLVGMFADGSVENCSADVNIVNVAPEGGSFPNYARTGGLIGEMYKGSISDSHAAGSIEALGHFVGGLVGSVTSESNEVKIDRSYATTDVTMVASGKSGYGGLVGTMNGKLTISDCYATGAIKAYRWSSGFVGSIYGGDLVVKNSFSSCNLDNVGPDSNGEHQDGVFLGNSMESEKRPRTVKVTGFVAWNVSDRAFCFPADITSAAGSYIGTSGTISSQAKTLGWDESIWDLSTDVPALK